MVEGGLLFLFLFDTGSHHVALTGPGLTVQTRLDSNLQRFCCVCILNAGIPGVYHHTVLETWMFLRVA